MKSKAANKISISSSQQSNTHKLTLVHPMSLTYLNVLNGVFQVLPTSAGKVDPEQELRTRQLCTIALTTRAARTGLIVTRNASHLLYNSLPTTTLLVAGRCKGKAGGSTYAVGQRAGPSSVGLPSLRSSVSPADGLES